jgi:hypothetical protein
VERAMDEITLKNEYGIYLTLRFNFPIIHLDLEFGQDFIYGPRIN